jgi:hypothetical protein
MSAAEMFSAAIFVNTAVPAVRAMNAPLVEEIEAVSDPPSGHLKRNDGDNPLI